MGEKDKPSYGSVDDVGLNYNFHSIVMLMAQSVSYYSCARATPNKITICL
jgi:hypothetical protein